MHATCGPRQEQDEGRTQAAEARTRTMEGSLGSNRVCMLPTSTAAAMACADASAAAAWSGS